MKLFLLAGVSLQTSVKFYPEPYRTGVGREGGWGSTVPALLHLGAKLLWTKHFRFKPEPSRLLGQERTYLTSSVHHFRCFSHVWYMGLHCPCVPGPQNSGTSLDNIIQPNNLTSVQPIYVLRLNLVLYAQVSFVDTISSPASQNSCVIQIQLEGHCPLVQRKSLAMQVPCTKWYNICNLPRALVLPRLLISHIVYILCSLLYCNTRGSNTKFACLVSAYFVQ